MRRYKWLVIILQAWILIPFSAKGTGSLSVSTLADSLKKNASAVVREDDMVLKVHSIRSATMEIRKSFTILDATGDKYAKLVLFYDKFSAPSGIRITLRDAFGDVIKEVKQGDISDMAAESDGELFSDNRVKVYSPSVNSYPYTVTMAYQVDFKGYLSFPEYCVFPGYDVSVENTSFELINESSSPIDIVEMNFDRFRSNLVKTDKSCSFRVSGIPAVQDEPMSPDEDFFIPVVYFFPHFFEYDGYPGDFSSWDTFAEWQRLLLSGRDQLPASTVSRLHALTDTLSGNYEKAKVIYEFLQKKVRYVSIQLGIGGFRPFAAEVVDKVGYGDCKALSNYYMAMLSAVNIPSLYTITRLDQEKSLLLPDHPSNIYFNHVMVCVPFGSDTVWAECTSGFTPFGYVGSYSEGKPALLITPDKGVLTTITNRSHIPDLASRNAEIHILADGSASLHLTRIYSGRNMEDALGQYVSSRKDQEKHLYEGLRLTDFTISSFRYNMQAPLHRIDQIIDLDCNKFCTVTGKRLMIASLLPSDVTAVPDNVGERKLPFILDRPVNETDTIRYLLGEGSTIESLPKPVAISNQFGVFSISYIPGEKEVTVVAELHLKDAEYPHEAYREFRDFMIAVQKAQRQKILIKLV